MIASQTLDAGGIATRFLRAGDPKSAFVFLHGGTPGVSPWAGGAHLWGGVLERFARSRAVVAIDSPGSGGTGVPAGPLTVDAMVDHAAACLDALGIERCHLVGHDLGGLVALSLAIRLPARVAAVTTVASLAASPTGDSVENLTLAHPPAPLWSRESQRWAFERISYSHHHIDASLLDACEAAAAGEAHRAAMAKMAGTGYGDDFLPSLAGAKYRFFEVCRTRGMPVPTQVIWGTHDPLGSFDQGLWQYRLAAMGQRAAQFHAINRAGALPFREEPDAFHGIVSAFADAVFAG